MKRLAFSIVTVLFAGGVIASGATGAFFSDTEASTDNVFVAGAFDLTVDNESYYNGNVCAPDAKDVNQNQNLIEYVWQGSAAYPVAGTPCTTSWGASDLGNGLLFFNFTDVKPDDEGEDTISLHVQNEAYACLDMTLTSDDDKSSNEPELGAGDVQEDVNNTWDGELAGTIQMFWWADDGDNVYEVGENQITPGVQTITNMFGQDRTFSAALADSVTNVWTPNNIVPLPANQTVYIAKAWCMGTLTLNPVPAGQGVNPSVASGVSCDGTTLGNISQTDGATMDIAFRAVQARNNGSFTCSGTDPRLATITVIKQIVNDNGGNNQVADYQLFVVGGGATPVTSGIATQVIAGNYFVTESGVSGYQASFSGDCNAAGQVTLAPGDNKTCTITNNDIAPSITLIKNVIGPALPVQFTMRIDGNVVPQNTSVPVSANSVHTISEDAFPGYTFTNITGGSCPLTVPGNVTLNEGQAITCTITNTQNI